MAVKHAGKGEIGLLISFDGASRGNPGDAALESAHGGEPSAH